MPEGAAAVLAVLLLLVLGAAVAALRAVLDGRLVGLPASVAVVAPAAEAARLVRQRPVGRRAGAGPVVAGVLLLLAPVLRTLALPVGGPPVLGLGWLVVADLLWWVGGALLVVPRRGALAPFVRCAAAVEVVLLVALAAVPAARSLPTLDVPVGAEAPVAFLLTLVVPGILLPWAVGSGRPVIGVGRLLVSAALAVQPVSAASVAAALFLGVDGGALVLTTVLLTAVLVVLARRFPVLPSGLIARPALTVLLPLAAVQLAIVVALAVLGS